MYWFISSATGIHILWWLNMSNVEISLKYKILRKRDIGTKPYLWRNETSLVWHMTKKQHTYSRHLTLCAANSAVVNALRIGTDWPTYQYKEPSTNTMLLEVADHALYEWFTRFLSNHAFITISFTFVARSIVFKDCRSCLQSQVVWCVCVCVLLLMLLMITKMTTMTTSRIISSL